MKPEAPDREALRLLHHVRALADMTAELAAAHDFPTTSRLLLLTLLGALAATRGGIWLYDPAEARLRPAATRGLEPAADDVPVAEAEVAALRAEPALIALEIPNPASALAGEFHSRCPSLVWAAPLVMREEFLGVLAVGARLNRRPYSPSELELLTTLVTMTASAIQSHRLISGLQEANQRLMQAQEQLIRTEQLATLGATAAGIAHEIGNPLQAILGFAHLIEQNADTLTPDEIRDFVRPVVNESERLRLILDELRDYARPKGYDMARVSLSSVLQDTLRFTQYDPLFRRLAAIEAHCEDDPPVQVNAGKIKQVLLNLLKNAAQAMHGREGECRLEMRLWREGTDACLAVSDNGPGIPPEHLTHIWEPFFTTKGPEGTGLGLDLCRQIVERHQGRISVRSVVGEGTTFTIRLPIAGEDSDLPQPGNHGGLPLPDPATIATADSILPQPGNYGEAPVPDPARIPGEDWNLTPGVPTDPH